MPMSHISLEAVTSGRSLSPSVVAGGRAGGRRKRPELAVAGIPQAGHDVAPLVQLAVHGPDVDLDVRIGRGQGGDPLRGGNDTCLIRIAPRPLRRSTVAALEPPVASIGSRIRHACTVAASGSLL